MSRRGSESTWQQKLSTFVNHVQMAQGISGEKIQKICGITQSALDRNITWFIVRNKNQQGTA